jgi:hypothetical protein
MSGNKTDPVLAKALQWLDANTAKNAATSDERKAAEQLQKLVAVDSVKSVEINPNLDLSIGWQDVPSEEIDPKLLFEKHPDKFWELVSVPKTNCIASLGEKETAKLMRTKTENKFKIQKVKK